MKSGFVSLVGRPNVGKSTLINSIIGKKIAITSNKGGTTRNNIKGIYNDDETQIVFVDTPGIHKPKEKLGKYLNRKAYFVVDDVDIVGFLVDASAPLGKGDKFVIQKFNELDKPVFLILNKIDNISKDELLKKIDEYKDLYPFAEIIPVSALKKDNIERFIEVVKGYLPDTIKYYEDDTTTSSSDSFIMAETIREKIMRTTEQEIPYAVTCVVESYKVKKDLLSITALIIVDRQNIKKMILGKQGSKIKDIGIKARVDLEKYFEKRVFLELFVKVVPKWRSKEKYLAEFGIKEID